MKNKFVIIEGGEGSGKSTIVKYLNSELSKKGINVCVTREPGGSRVAENIRKSFINDKLAPISQLFCFLAARAVWTEQVLIPKLKECDVVITDRSYPTTYSYQGVVGKIGLDAVVRLNRIAMRKINPDLVIILDIDAKTGLTRSRSTGETNAFEKESIQFHTKANKAYLELARTYNWKVVDARKPLIDVKRNVLNIITELINLNS